MQLIALDQKKRSIFANNASKGVNYFCRECHGVLRLRGGLHRKKHFFHLGSKAVCSSANKSAKHVAIQYYLYDQLPKGECLLEKAFASIHRIADVVWEKEKLIFEIQCSFITKEEIDKRTFDYRSLGYTVVWILHDAYFNRFRAKACELYLKKVPHYYTNMDAFGRGIIYDQIALFFQTRFRKIFFKTTHVDLCFPKIVEKRKTSPLFRLRYWTVHFENDVIDLWRGHDETLLVALCRRKDYQSSFYKKAKFSIEPFIKIGKAVKNLYLQLFHILLEKGCK